MISSMNSASSVSLKPGVSTTVMLGPVPSHRPVLKVVIFVLDLEMKCQEEMDDILISCYRVVKPLDCYVPRRESESLPLLLHMIERKFVPESMADLEREALADLLVSEGGEVVVPDERVGQGGLAHALQSEA